MNSPPATSNSTSPAAVATKGRGLSRWQFGLRSLLLLITLFGVWTSYFLNRQAVLRLKDRIASARPLANELRVDDPTQAAIAELPESWMDEFGWQCYLPPGNYQLCLATVQIGRDGKGPVIQKCPIGAGKHQLSLTLQRQSESHKLEVTIDGKAGFTVVEPPEWNPSVSSEGGANFSLNQQQPANQPVILFRRRFRPTVQPNSQLDEKATVNGILLWIEPLTSDEAQGNAAEAHSPPVIPQKKDSGPLP